MQIEVTLQTYKALTQLMQSETDTLEDVIARRIRITTLKNPTAKSKAKASITPETIGTTGFWLFDQWYPCKTAEEVMIRSFQLFIELDDVFMEVLSGKVGGRKRPYIARSPEELYLDNPDLQRNATARLCEGWYIGKNENNKTKIRLLKAACEVLGIKFDADFKIRLK